MSTVENPYRRLDDIREAVRSVYRLLDEVAQEAKRRALDDPLQAVHEIRRDGGDEHDAIIATFRGPVPRIGEAVWTDHGAWRVTDVAWWVLPMPNRASASRACVYVETIRKAGADAGEDGCSTAPFPVATFERPAHIRDGGERG